MKLEKITTKSGRHYDDACGAAHALDLAGERWALLVMREMMYGPRRFSDLRADLPGISANVLTQRLEGLEAAGIVRRRKLPPPASVQVYELTPWGLESEPIFLALGRWAARSPRHDPTLPLSAVSMMMSLKAMIDPARAAGLALTAGFVFGEETFRARLSGGEVTVERGETDGADFVIEAPPAVTAGVVYGDQPVETFEAQGLARLTGDRELARRFIGLFSLPQKAG